MNATDQHTLFEAEAHSAVARALDSVRATEEALDDAANGLLRGSAAGYRDLEKVRELHRLAAVRLEVFVRRLGEGRIEEGSNGVTP